jgi:hypothetical protein
MQNSERRELPERRHRIWWSAFYGGFRPRRRSPRRVDISRFHASDWHDSHLLAVAIGILLLCVVDACMTLVLLSAGADEVNPVMAAFVYKSTGVFTAVKMAMTGVGVVFMVFMARYRFMRLIRVQVVMYAILAGYAVLIAYEMSMFKDMGYALSF